MTEVRWTTQTADDLEAIYDFIARDSQQYAQLIVQGILAAQTHPTLKRKAKLKTDAIYGVERQITNN